MKTLSKEFSCGFKIEYTEEEAGTPFNCERCHNIHSLPIPHELKTKREKQRMAKEKTGTWGKFLSWFKNLFQINKWFSKNRATIDTSYVEISSNTNPTPKIPHTTQWNSSDNSFHSSPDLSARKRNPSNGHSSDPPVTQNKNQELKKWVIGAVYKGDKDRFEYGFRYWSKKYPQYTEEEILEKIKYDFLRDN